MAAKSLDEAIEIGVTRAHGPEFRQIIKNELKDFFAHKVMQSPLAEKDSEGERVLVEFFHSVFKEEA